MHIFPPHGHAFSSLLLWALPYTRFCPLLRTYPPCTSTRSSYLMCACSCAWRKPSPQCCPPRTHDAPTRPVCHTPCTCTWTHSFDFTGTYTIAPNASHTPFPLWCLPCTLYAQSCPVHQHVYARSDPKFTRVAIRNSRPKRSWIYAQSEPAPVYFLALYLASVSGKSFDILSGIPTIFFTYNIWHKLTWSDPRVLSGISFGILAHLLTFLLAFYLA